MMERDVIDLDCSWCPVNTLVLYGEKAFWCPREYFAEIVRVT